MPKATVLLRASFAFLAACDSGSSTTPGTDATTDVAVETASDGPGSEASNDGARDAPASEAGSDAQADAVPDASPDQSSDAPLDADAGPCTAPLDTFNCPPNFPSDLRSACPHGSIGPAPFPVTYATCGSLTALVFGGPPHFSFCLYSGVDAGGLVGAQGISDINELCNNTSYTVTGGQVPSSCAGKLYFAATPAASDSGAVTIQCSDAGDLRDAAGG